MSGCKYKVRYRHGGCLVAHFHSLELAWASMVKHGDAVLLRRGADLRYAEATPETGPILLPLDWQGMKETLFLNNERAHASLSADHRELCRLAYGSLPMVGA